MGEAYKSQSCIENKKYMRKVTKRIDNKFGDNIIGKKDTKQ